MNTPSMFKPSTMLKLVDQQLAHIGLQRRRSPLATAAVVAACGTAGLLVGATAMLLLAPSSGAAVRKRVAERLSSLTPARPELKVPPMAHHGAESRPVA